MKWSLMLMAGLVACGGKTPAPGPPPAPAATCAAAKAPEAPPPAAKAEPAEGDDVEQVDLQVSGKLVAQCPQLKMVHDHAAQIPEDRLWVVVLMAIGQCMQPDGALSTRSIGVSGGEDPIDVIRQVLAHSGIDPERIKPTQGPPGVVQITLIDDAGQL